MLDQDLHNTSGQVQATAQLIGCIGSASRAAARLTGYTDFGNLSGSEMKGEAKTTDIIKATRGRLTRAGYLPGMMTLGYEFTTLEVADARKLRFALLGDPDANFAQAAVASGAADAIVFSGGAPSRPGVWYPILKAGVRVYALSALTIAGKTEGVDFWVDYKNGWIRFDTTQTASVTPTVAAPSIDSASPEFMQGVMPMQRSFWRGYWTVLIWDQTPGNNLVLRHEEFLGDLKVTAWPKFDGENASEMKFEISINTGDPARIWHRP